MKTTQRDATVRVWSSLIIIIGALIALYAVRGSILLVSLGVIVIVAGLAQLVISIRVMRNSH